MKILIMKLLSKFIFILGMAVLLFGCSKDGDLTSLGQDGNPVYGGKVEMTFGFTAADMENPVKVIPVANRGNAPIVLEDVPESIFTKAVNEDALNDVWVLQFDGTENTSCLVLCEYFSADKIQDNKLSIGLYETGMTKVYCIANAGKDKFASLPVGTTTLESFETMIFDFDAGIADGKGLPMAGVYEGSAVAATADISLHRMAAKLTFTLKVDIASSNDSFTPTTVQLKSVAKGTSYKSRDISVVYPARDAGNFRDYAAVSVTGSAEDLKTKGFTQEWYLPENLRGVVAGLNDQQKGGSNAPEYSTYIEITGNYTQSREVFDVIYRIYPGQNSSTDFNVIRNHRYTIGSTIRGIDENDVRVEVNKGEDLSLSGTANCYLVHKAGTTYKFDATVMGNGAITPYYISNEQSAPVIDGTKKLSPASAKVLWETYTGTGIPQEGEVILPGSIKEDGRYVYFTTAGNKGDTIKEGNALIGIFDTDGILIWSWHIWATRYDPEKDNDTYLTRGLKASSADNIALTPSRTYTVMKYNLGADATSAEGEVGRFGLLYQWGRKDPFIGAKSTKENEMSFAQTNNVLGYEWKSRNNKEVISTAGADSSIAYAIQHPTTFLYNDNGDAVYDWLNVSNHTGQRDNLWGNPNTATTFPNQDRGSKSIYDPCPVGWRVAPQDTWTRFAKNGTGGGEDELYISSNFTCGHNFYCHTSGKTAFYPAAGCRFRSDGQLHNVGSEGFMWSSSPNTATQNYGGRLTFSKSSVHPLHGDNRSNGFSVRCVKENF